MLDRGEDGNCLQDALMALPHGAASMLGPRSMTLRYQLWSTARAC